MFVFCERLQLLNFFYICSRCVNSKSEMKNVNDVLPPMPWIYVVYNYDFRFRVQSPKCFIHRLHLKECTIIFYVMMC